VTRKSFPRAKSLGDADVTLQRSIDARVCSQSASERSKELSTAVCFIAAHMPMMCPMQLQQTNIHDAFFKTALSKIEQILSYVAKGPVAVSMEIVQQALHRLESSRREQIMKGFGMAFAQEYIERGIEQGLAEAKARAKAEGEAEGKAQGEAQGEAKGHVKGQATALIRVLKKRFGRLPPNLHMRISAADAMSIEVWLDRAIDALDLQSVFGAESMGSSRPRVHETH
jgi:hypothetical protein